MTTSFLQKLDAIREDYGQPIIISSGYRCSHYNKQISSTGTDGPHTTGRAVDIPVHGEEAVRLMQVALKYGMTGFGVKQKGPFNKRFIHLDDLENGLRPTMWSY
jgi:uncharacterized protein YcbK (DUF882 family)